jgi:hypothetical protein
MTPEEADRVRALELTYPEVERFEPEPHASYSEPPISIETESKTRSWIFCR